MSNMFANAMKHEAAHTYTENGARALNTTFNSCLDLYGTIGALRSRPVQEVLSLFSEAYKEDPLVATKILFYARDIREGLGERKVFRDILEYLAIYHPEAVLPNIDLIGVYGRYDDLYCLIGTPLEEDMWKSMKKQLLEDIENAEKNRAISLLAKWIKTPDASSEKTRQLGIRTAKKLGYSVYAFKRILRKLRKHIGVVEALMSAGKWDEIKYPEVPSRAMMIYRNAFRRHDEDRFGEFTTKAVRGEEKINSSTLYPYDIIEKFMPQGYWRCLFEPEQKDLTVLEAQWRQLPNYVEPGTNAIVVADVSGSMSGRPMATSVGLAMYFAERNTGAYHNMFMTFSENPTVVNLKGETLLQKVKFLTHADWGMNTNLERAFMRVLRIAIDNHIPPEEMVKSIIVISDMEIDCCTNGNSSTWSFYDTMKARYADAGYEIPNIVFWNVNSRHNVFHADHRRKGVQLCSGQSVTVFKQLMQAIGMTPVEMMMKTINSDRYSAITIA